jgi:biotin carboxylase
VATLLFLGAGVSQLPGIRRARAAGHRVIGCDGAADAVGLAECDLAAVVDFSDVDAVEAVAAREGVDGILAVCTDRGVVPAAVVAERLGLAGIGPAVATRMTHKPTMRRHLAACGVPQPRYAVVASAHDATDALRFPVVLKPADSGGQRGLYLVERRSGLRDALPQAIAVSKCGEALLEEYVDGDELNGLYVVRNGEPTLLTLSDRLRPRGVAFGVGWIHSFPSALPPEQLAEADRVASAAIRCLGLRDGIAFPQLLVSRDGVVVVEVAARIAAGQMADLVLHATGIDVYEIAIAQALGREVPDELVAPKFTRAVAIRFLTASPGFLPVGKVASIDGIDDARSHEGVLDVGLYFDVGAEIGPLRVDADRRGYVIATGADAQDALRVASEAAAKVRVGVA